jgi:hypothetical protein
MQNGAKPSAQAQYEMGARYVATPRDLAEFVHHDYPFQAYLGAALILSNLGQDCLSETNPYRW